MATLIFRNRVLSLFRFLLNPYFLKSAETKLLLTPEDKDTKAPTITITVNEFNVFGGKTVTLEVGKLSIGGTEAATWTDDKTVADKLKAEVKFDGKAIGSGTALSESGTLTVTVTDEAGN